MRHVLSLALLGLCGLARAQYVKPAMSILDAVVFDRGVSLQDRDRINASIRAKAIDILRDSIVAGKGSGLEALGKADVMSCSNASCVSQIIRANGGSYALETRIINLGDKWTVNMMIASATSQEFIVEKMVDYPSQSAMMLGIPDLASMVLHEFSGNMGSASVVLLPPVAASPAARVVAPSLLAAPDDGSKRVVLSFTSQPAGASVSADGNFLCLAPCSKMIYAGIHDITMGKAGFQQKKASVNAAENGQQVNWTLDPVQAKLSLLAIDDNRNDLVADIYADGKKVGQTPFDGMVPVNAGKIEVAREGYDRQEVKVILMEGRTAQATVQMKSFVAQAAAKATPAPAVAAETFTDNRDGHVYRYVQIGTQTWMAENLAYLATGSWCYEDKSENCDKYGRLYSWYQAMDLPQLADENAAQTVSSPHQGICPEGWYIPSDAEWKELADHVGVAEAGTKLKSRTGWALNGDGTSGNGSDSFGFGVLPAGYRYDMGTFGDQGYESDFWSYANDGSGTVSGWDHYFVYNSTYVKRYSNKKACGYSLRCVRND